MKPVDTMAKDVRNLFDLIHHYDLNYDKKILAKCNLKNNALNLIKSMLHFAWTHEADILHPTEREMAKFTEHGMQVKVTVDVSIDYPDERLSVTLVDYI